MMSQITIDPTRALKRPYLPGSETARTPLVWPENAARPSWVRRAVSAAGNGVGTATAWGLSQAEAVVLAEPHLQPLRGTIKGHAIAGGFWGLTLAASTAIAL